MTSETKHPEKKANNKKAKSVGFFTLFKKLRAYIKPYKWLVVGTLTLTLAASFLAQVNALILRYAVDELTVLVTNNSPLASGITLLITISVILLSKEAVMAVIQYGQKYFGEKIKIYVSRDFAQGVVDKILTYKMAYYTSSENESGKLQTRIDLGISSLTQLVKNFFIDILPLFTTAFIALVLMFQANFYIGLVSLCVIPIFFFVSELQARKLKGFRRKMRGFLPPRGCSSAD